MSDNDPNTPEWFCGCGGGDPKQCLADILNGFAKELDDGSPYINLDAIGVAHEKYRSDAVELVMYFLDHLGYMEHFGAVSSSGYLTPKGVALREWANGR